VPVEQLGGFFGAPTFLPASHEPFGVGIADVGLGRLEFGEQGFGGVELAEVTAEDGVDESGLGAEASLFCLFNSFIDGGMVRDAVEPEDLVEAKSQEVLQHRLLRAAWGGLAGNEPVKGGLPADDAVNELLREASVGWGKMGASKRGVEEVFHEI